MAMMIAEESGESGLVVPPAIQENIRRTMQYLAGVDPFHAIVEAGMIFFILFLLTQRSHKPKVDHPFTEKEVQELIDDWAPEPLVPGLTAEEEELNSTPYCMTGIDQCNGRPVINMVRANFLGLLGNKTIEDVATKALRYYGCGSCGPRAFYGSLDAHLELETSLAKFMQAEAAILYSFGYETVASAIPTFSKIGDVIFCDESVSHPIQTGVYISRSNVVWFKHNDMEDLEKKLHDWYIRNKKSQLTQRRFVVVEGLYYNQGDIVPLPQLLKLKETYPFRIIMDESFSFATMGATGRGITEHYGLPSSSVDILTASISNALGAIGGFCCGSETVVKHQILNSTGYVFSASLPPFISRSADAALNELGAHPEWLTDLSRKSALLHKGFSKIPGLVVTSVPISPVIHIRLAVSRGSRLQDELALQRIVDMCFHSSDKSDNKPVMLTRAKYVSGVSHGEKFLPEPSIRVCASVEHSAQDVEQAISTLRHVAGEVLGTKRITRSAAKP